MLERKILLFSERCSHCASAIKDNREDIANGTLRPLEVLTPEGREIFRAFGLKQVPGLVILKEDMCGRDVSNDLCNKFLN